ncbi:hypothetical protein [Streptomyces sp. NPDC047976]|uniref:hypothetical protein n=1 Tax=unclassified Streptomyces TaxID=2593676 RepID=UPI00341C226D
MNGSRKLALGAAAVALTVGGAFAVSSASAEPKAVGARATTTAWAKVSADGLVLGSQGIGRLERFGTGRYRIAMPSSVAGCALLGTVNTNGGGDPGLGSASILVGISNATTVYVRTATPSASGSATVDSDRPFSITIVCP